MAGVDAIYGMLAWHPSLVADEALLLALERAEGPFAQRIVDTLLARGRAGAMAGLIARLETMPEDLKWRCLARADRLAGGLFRAAGNSNPAVRRTCLNLIRNNHLLRLAELPAMMLRDGDRGVGDLAAGTLLRLARREAASAGARKSFLDSDLQAESPRGQVRRRRGELAGDPHERLRAALRAAVDNFSKHRHLEALMAAMVAVPATDPYFWRAELEPYAPVGRAARQLLVECDEPYLAHFVVSALGHASLRAAAARAIAGHRSPRYIAAVAREFVLNGSESVLFGAKLVRNPAFFGAIGSFFGEIRENSGALDPAEQADVLELILALEAADRDRAKVLLTVAQAAAPRVAVAAVRAIAELERPVALEALAPLARAEQEAVALTAVAYLRRLGYPAMRRLALGLMRSEHERLGRWARKYLGEFMFRRYWERFGQLEAAAQAMAGRALFKADPQARGRLEERMAAGSAGERLRAVQVARVAGCVDESLGALRRLMGDGDSRVRSCATAALGEARGAAGEVKSYLVRALRDRDDRVRANAIEALDAVCGAEVAPALRALVGDANNRVRANAIMVLLRHGVDPGGEAIGAMLSDRRAAHRRSAEWVMRTLAEAGGAGEEFSQAEAALLTVGVGA